MPRTRAQRPSRPSPIVQHQYVSVERQRFHCFSWGTEGPPIVLVHGTGFHGYVWKPVAQGLSLDARVFALDQRGHGDSFKPESGYAWEHFAEDLYHVLTGLGLAAVTAVGHSAGATAIALCAATHPGTISRAVLIDPILFPGSPDGRLVENPLAYRARKRRMVWESRTSMFHSYRAREPFKTWREDALWAYIEEGTALRADGHIELKCPGTIEALVFENAPKLNGFAVLPQIDIPVLLLRGELSDAFSEAGATHALSLLPQGQLQTIAHTTHFVPMERPEAVEGAVRKFMFG
jgi:pimeloyl-ACP methyl ester carboxylesterase